jgi:hypothetical protein
LHGLDAARERERYSGYTAYFGIDPEEAAPILPSDPPRQ